MYNKIVNPITGRKININSKLGKKILSNYYFHLLSGGFPKENEEKKPLLEEEIHTDSEIDLDDVMLEEKSESDIEEDIEEKPESDIEEDIEEIPETIIEIMEYNKCTRDVAENLLVKDITKNVTFFLDKSYDKGYLDPDYNQSKEKIKEQLKKHNWDLEKLINIYEDNPCYPEKCNLSPEDLKKRERQNRR